MKIYIYFYSRIYQGIMRFSHKHNWHYAPPTYPDGDIHLWCKWCGFRETIKTAEKGKESKKKLTQTN